MRRQLLREVLPREQPSVEALAPGATWIGATWTGVTCLGLHLPAGRAAGPAPPIQVCPGGCARREGLTLGSPCQAAGLGSSGPTCRARLPSLPGIFAHCAGGLL